MGSPTGNVQVLVRILLLGRHVKVQVPLTMQVARYLFYLNHLRTNLTCRYSMRLLAYIQNESTLTKDRFREFMKFKVLFRSIDILAFALQTNLL